MENEKLKNILAKNLAHFRKLSGLTQTELAEKLNYSDKSVSKWERAEGFPDIIVLENIARIFGVTLNDLVDENSVNRKKIKKPLTKKKKILITILSAGLVWFVITSLFVFLSIILSFVNADFSGQWIVFVYAIPIMSIVTLIFSEIFHWKISSVLSVSLLIWGLTISFHLSSIVFMFSIPKITHVYLIPAVFQVLVCLWYLLRFYKLKKM